MSERPELTILRMCPTCGGTTDARFSEKGREYSREHGTNDCPDCTDGTIRVAVSCQTCVYWRNEGGFGQYCIYLNRDLKADFGCLGWQGKEATGDQD